ncbi:MAG: pyruvate kinase, partial [Thermoplasmata archaeon]|nr:pyruvate kinase [Thermoplasmata archaeon]
MRARGRSADVAAAVNLIRELERIRGEVVGLERRQPLRSFGIRRASARNLVDYLAFRRFDARGIQETLARLGLSSLGHAESHVRGNLDSVLRQLYLLSGRPAPVRPPSDSLGPESGRNLIDRHARALLGPARPGRRTRIMVTVPSELATNSSLVRELLDAGMDCMRINCAHDSVEVWSAMIANLRRAERGTGRRCRVEMDLCGPRLRTGPLAPGPAVLKIRPTRNELGRVLRPGAVWLVRDGDPDPEVEEGVRSAHVPGEWLARRRLGATIVLTDSRGSSRTFRVAAIRRGARLLTTSKTTYLAQATELRSRPAPGARWDVTNASVPARPGVALIRPGETVRLTSRAGVGHRETRDEAGRLRSASVFPVLPPEALRSLRVGDRVWFDGGRVGAVATRVHSGEALLRVTHVRPEGVRLGADKGLNLPDSPLTIPPLTPKDLSDLDFVAAHADMVGYSFVQSAADVRALRRELARRAAPERALVLKIETGRAFELLPEIVLAALHAPVTGVMIARGDLAVEVGYERLAEVQ